MKRKTGNTTERTGTLLLNTPYIIWSAIFIIVPLIMVVFYTFTTNVNVYLTEFTYNGEEHSCKIEAATGAVLKFDGEDVTDTAPSGAPGGVNGAQKIAAEYFGIDEAAADFTKTVLETELGGFTLDNIKSINTESTRHALLLSFLYSLAATAVSLILAYPFAYVLSRSKVKTQRIQMLLIMLPMWMNMLIRTYSWMNILENNGIINKLITSLGMEPVTMLGTPGAVILGMVYNYLPYMILPIYTIMTKISPSLLEAADDLGCNGLQKLKRVIMPLSMPGVVSGLIMVFVPSISTFYISQKMSNGKIKLIGDLIENKIKNEWSSGGLNQGAAMSLILMVIILICTFIMNRFADEDGGGLAV